jgi:hypothetical protein
MGVLISLASGLFGGVIAWFATNYYGRNLLRFWDQRLEAHKALFLLHQMPEGGERLCQLAAEIEGLRVILPKPLHWFLCIRGYDLHLAAKGLTELSNRLGSGGVDEAYDTACLRVHIQQALRLPKEPHDLEIAQSRGRLENADVFERLIR